jgi:hypothetical protein
MDVPKNRVAEVLVLPFTAELWGGRRGGDVGELVGNCHYPSRRLAARGALGVVVIRSVGA